MSMQGEVQRVTIYIGESDHYRGASLSMAVLNFLHREGAAGATVTRGLAGFGSHNRIHTANIESLALELPIRIEWIDEPDRVARLLPQVRRMVSDGLITLEKLDVIPKVADPAQDPLDQPVGQIMREEVVSVLPQTPLSDIVSLLLERGLRSVPVVDREKRVIGIITDGDLLRKTGVSMRLRRQSGQSIDQLVDEVARVRTYHGDAADIMTEPVTTVRRSDSVRTAVARMARMGLKRLPVVDDEKRLVGIISRLDVFRAVEHERPLSDQEDEMPQVGRSVTQLMHTNVPTVSLSAPLEEVVRALEKSQRRRAVVLDAQGRVAGIITDGDLLRRSIQSSSPGLIGRLRSLFTGEPAVTSSLPDAGETAATLMSAPAIVVHTDSTLAEALHLMTIHAVKRLPVVDEAGRLVGLLGRSSVLRGLLEDDPAAAAK